MRFAGAVVALWSLTQEEADLSHFDDKYFLSLNWLNSVKTFRKNSMVSIEHFDYVLIHCDYHAVVVS